MGITSSFCVTAWAVPLCTALTLDMSWAVIWILTSCRETYKNPSSGILAGRILLSQCIPTPSSSFSYNVRRTRHPIMSHHPRELPPLRQLIPIYVDTPVSSAASNKQSVGTQKHLPRPVSQPSFPTQPKPTSVPRPLYRMYQDPLLVHPPPPALFSYTPHTSQPET